MFDEFRTFFPPPSGVFRPDPPPDHHLICFVAGEAGARGVKWILKPALLAGALSVQLHNLLLNHNTPDEKTLETRLDP